MIGAGQWNGKNKKGCHMYYVREYYARLNSIKTNVSDANMKISISETK